MSYALSFADRFFAHAEIEAILPSERPVSVYQAIVSLREDSWRGIARNVFGISARRLTPDAVFAKVIETDTCSNIDEPVEVWIDRAGKFWLKVYSPETDSVS